MADAVAEHPGEATPQPKITLRKSRLLPEFPYPGLRPFRKDEWPIFCGRSEIVDELLSALGATHFVPVLGTSGCGKSSIIKAGLIATLEREHGALGSVWRATEMRPENSPMWNLTEALWRATHEDQLGSPEELSRMRASLGRGPGGIERVLKEYGYPADRNLLILVDQFEELFRFGVLGGEEEIQLFTDQLIDVFTGRPHGIHVTLTMRADFIADCARWPRLADALNRTAYLLRWLTEAEMREAISTPARLYRGTVDADLVDRMIRDVGGKPDQLPIIQHALMWMWNRAAETANPGRLTLAEYEGPAVGGVEGALSLHADNIYEGMTEARPKADGPTQDLRLPTKRLFQALSDVDASNRAIRRPCAFGELRAITGCAVEELQYIVDQFRKPGTSFLMPDDVAQLQDNDTIDVSHEALIRQWSKMQGRGPDDGWLAEERRDAENWRALAREVRKFRDAKQKGRERYLSGDQNDDLQAWWKERAPSAAWAARYSADAKLLFPFIDELLLISAKRARWQAIQRKLLILTPVVLVLALFGASLGWLDHLKQQETAKKIEAVNQVTAGIAHTAAEDWRATEALILTQYMLKGRATALTQGIGYRALSRQYQVTTWPEAVGADWSRDGRFIAVGSRNQGQIIGPRTGIPQGVDFSDLGDVQNLAIAPDGSKLAASNGAGTLLALGSPADPNALRAKVDGFVEFLWFTPDGKWVVASDSQNLIVLDARNNQEAARWPEQLAVDMAISDDSATLATVSYDGHLTIRAFSKITEPLREIDLVRPSSAAGDENQDGAAGQPTISGDRKLVAIPMLANRIELINFVTGSRYQIPYSSATAPTSVRFSHDGNWLVVGSIDGSLRRIATDEIVGRNAKGAIDNTPGELLPSIPSTAAVAHIRFSNDDMMLVETSQDGTALVINLLSRATLPLKPLSNVIVADFFGADGNVLTFTGDQALRLWNPTPRLAPERLDAMPGWAFGSSSASRVQATKNPLMSKPAPQTTLDLVYRNNTPSVATKADGNPIRIYSSGTEAYSTIDQSEAAQQFDMNGEAMAYVEPESGMVMSRAAGAESWQEIGTVSSKASIRRVLSDGQSRALVVLNAESGSGRFEWYDFDPPEASPLPRHTEQQSALAITPRAILMTSAKGGAVTFATLGGDQATEIELPLADIASAVKVGALSEDGRYAAALQENGTVSVWDTKQGTLVALFGELEQRLANVAFDPSGASIDAVGLDGTVYRWPLLSQGDLAKRIQEAIPKDANDDVQNQVVEFATATGAAPE